MLKLGLSGIGIDLNLNACYRNKILNNEYIKSGKYSVVNGDFLNSNFNEDVDCIISSMVIEHFNERQLNDYFKKCRELIHPKGKIITFVPACKSLWGIEDEIAGHKKRYEFEDVKMLADRFHLKIDHCVGLTFPISNILLPISNYLVRKSESKLLYLSSKEKTILSGDRNVFLKTRFPKMLRLVLNEHVLYPFHIIQKAFRNNKMSAVIYFEFIL